MMRRTSSATRLSVVSRSSEVFTASATSNRNDSTRAGETVCACVVSTVLMIAAAHWAAGLTPGPQLGLATRRAQPLHLNREDRARPDQHNHRGFQRQRGQDYRLRTASACRGRL